MLEIFNRKALLNIVRDDIHTIVERQYSDHTLLVKLHSMNLGAESFGDKTSQVKDANKKAVIEYMA